MNSLKFRSLFAVATMALLAACGGNAPADQFTRTAAVMEHGPAPVADCEAEGCNQPRIVDGLAEQYRFGAIQQQAQQKEQEPPVEPVAASEPVAQDVLVAAATEAAPAAGVQAQ